MTFTNKKDGSIWPEYKVAEYIKRLEAQVKGNRCNASKEAVEKVIAESRARVRSGRVLEASTQEKNPPNTAGVLNYYRQMYGVEPNIKVELPSRIKSASSTEEPASIRNYKRLMGDTEQFEQDQEQQGSIKQASTPKPDKNASWNNYNRLINGGVE